MTVHIASTSKALRIVSALQQKITKAKDNNNMINKHGDMAVIN